MSAAMLAYLIWIPLSTDYWCTGWCITPLVLTCRRPHGDAIGLARPLRRMHRQRLGELEEGRPDSDGAEHPWLGQTNEWTGVPLRFLVDLVGKDRGSTWMLAEGGDGAAVDRSIPLTDEIMDEAFVAYGQNGEPLRPAHGFPIRLIMPGFEGNLNIKWLRRLKFGDRPWMTRWETARYTQLLANGKARQFQLRMEANSVITAPSGMMEVRPGYHRISGLAWSGHGKIAKVEVSTDAGKTWKEAQLNQSGAAEGAVAVSVGLGLGRQAYQDRQSFDRRKGQCPARSQNAHQSGRRERAVSL